MTVESEQVVHPTLESIVADMLKTDGTYRKPVAELVAGLTGFWMQEGAKANSCKWDARQARHELDDTRLDEHFVGHEWPRLHDAAVQWFSDNEANPKWSDDKTERKAHRYADESVEHHCIGVRYFLENNGDWTGMCDDWVELLVFLCEFGEIDFGDADPEDEGDDWGTED